MAVVEVGQHIQSVSGHGAEQRHAQEHPQQGLERRQRGSVEERAADQVEEQRGAAPAQLAVEAVQAAAASGACAGLLARYTEGLGALVQRQRSSVRPPPGVSANESICGTLTS